MAWRVAQTLEVLLGEINTRSPRRSKVSDGSIGDAAHASRTSDHNPWVKDGAMGVVTARDFTDDPGDGFDASSFAEWLRQRCQAGTERRVKYVISDRRIAGSIGGWAWRPYAGLNAHTRHVHVSVHSAKSLYDSKGPWGWSDRAPAKQEDIMQPSDWEDHKLTEADARALGDPKREGELVGWSSLLRFPPAVERLRAEQAARDWAVRAELTAHRTMLAQILERLPADPP